jgi:hypothetical protein
MIFFSSGFKCSDVLFKGGAIAPTTSLVVKSAIKGFRLLLGDCLLRGKIPLPVLVKSTRLRQSPAASWICIQKDIDP